MRKKGGFLSGDSFYSSLTVSEAIKLIEDSWEPEGLFFETEEEFLCCVKDFKICLSSLIEDRNKPFV